MFLFMAILAMRTRFGLLNASSPRLLTAGIARIVFFPLRQRRSRRVAGRPESSGRVHGV